MESFAIRSKEAGVSGIATKNWNTAVCKTDSNISNMAKKKQK
jgi:hypothetical protein